LAFTFEAPSSPSPFPSRGSQEVSGNRFGDAHRILFSKAHAVGSKLFADYVEKPELCLSRVRRWVLNSSLQVPPLHSERPQESRVVPFRRARRIHFHFPKPLAPYQDAGMEMAELYLKRVRMVGTHLQPKPCHCSLPTLRSKECRAAASDMCDAQSLYILGSLRSCC